MLIDNIYTLLPRYVKNIPTTDPQNHVSSELVVEFELNHQSFMLCIFPARIRDKAGDQISVYPGPLEEEIEQALRKLAVPENINFKPKTGVLSCIASQLLYHIFQSSGKRFSISEIESGLEVLNMTSYELKYDEGEFNFRPFKRFWTFRRREEKIYSIEFTEFFFSKTDTFDFAFPNFIKGRAH